MARSVLSPVTSSTASGGTILSAAAAVDQANGNQFVNPTGRAIIEITNGGGANINATFTTTGVYNVGTATYAIADLVVPVTLGTTKVVGPFDKALFNDSNTGAVFVDWSSGTSVTARVIEMGAN